MPRVTLSDSQRALVNNAHERGMNDPRCRHLLNAATGYGKTEIGSEVIFKFLEQFEHHRDIPPIAWLSERKVLQDETEARLRDAGHRTVNFCDSPAEDRHLVPGRVNMIRPQVFVKRNSKKEGITYQEGYRPIAYATEIADLYLDEEGWGWGWLIADEGQHAASDYYGSCIRAWRGPVFSLTGTAWLLNPRSALGEGMAGEGQKCGPFTTIEFGPTPRELVGSWDDPTKRLSELEVISVANDVKLRHGDLKKSIMNQDGYDGVSVDKAVDRILATGPRLIREWENHGSIPCLWFCRTKKAAAEVTRLYESQGYKRNNYRCGE